LSDLLRIEAFESFDFAVLPAIDYFTDLPPILDFLVKAFEFLLVLD